MVLRPLLMRRSKSMFSMAILSKNNFSFPPFSFFLIKSEIWFSYAIYLILKYHDTSGFAVIVNPEEQVHDLNGRARVQIARRLVQQQ